MVVLDTNIIIDHLRQGKSKNSHLTQLVRANPEDSLAISMITVQELYGGQSTKNAAVEQGILWLVSSLTILPYTFEVAHLSGEIARDREKPIEFADAAIAATTIVNGAELFTLNKKDFEKIKELELI